MNQSEQPGLIKSTGICLSTGIGAITSVFQTVDNLAKTAEAHSAKYKATALAELSAVSLDTFEDDK